MKTIWGKLFQKESYNLVAKHLSSDGIELITDDHALSLRGGDKDYSPVYEHEAEKQHHVTDPSILLKL